MRPYQNCRKIARQAAGRVIHCAMILSLLQSVAKSRAEFYFVQRFVQQKRLRDNTCYTVQFSSNLSRNAIARQVVEKIAQYNRAFRIHSSLCFIRTVFDMRMLRLEFTPNLRTYLGRIKTISPLSLIQILHVQIKKRVYDDL